MLSFSFCVSKTARSVKKLEAGETFPPLPSPASALSPVSGVGGEDISSVYDDEDDEELLLDVKKNKER